MKAYKLKITILILLINSTLLSQDAEKPEPPKLKSDFVYAGYSAILPGLGQIKKDRLYTGIFFFSAFAASVYNYKLNYDRFQEAEKAYRQATTTMSLYNNVFLSGNFGSYTSIYLINAYNANQVFAVYKDAESKTNQAALFAVAIYLFQIGHAYFCSPGNVFDKPTEVKSPDSSSFNLNLYPTKNQFGQSGTNVDVTYSWRF
jgi:hypothetical protein